MIESTELAKYIISLAKDQDIDLGETKLHKLIYICAGYALALGVDLVKEKARAWNYGPVYPNVRKWLEKNPNAFQQPQMCSSKTLETIKEVNAEGLINRVVSSYGKWTASALSLWSHKPNSPWELAIADGGGLMNSPISKTDMEAYFKTLLKHD
jgi:uncharacterized phage-associated protein